MTDNKIIKALGCCANHDCCRLCPLWEDCGDLAILTDCTLNLINRQKAEIEKKDRAFEELIKVARLWKEKYNNAKEENKRLERHTKLHEEIQADAIKKYLDNLIDISVCKDYGDGTERLYVSILEATRVLKEMVGEY